MAVTGGDSNRDRSDRSLGSAFDPTDDLADDPVDFRIRATAFAGESLV